MRINKQIAIGINNKQVIVESLNNHYQIFTQLNSLEKDIYFIYADSDIQKLFYSSSYYKKMESAFILLMLFKPISTSLIISASSFLSSPLTNLLKDKFKILAEEPNCHFKVLRKETSWVQYAEKREVNTHELAHIERYKKFSKSEISKIFDGLSVVRKNNNSGWDTSIEWLKRIERILPQIDKNKHTIKDISDLPDEILDSSIFVWEVISEKLKERGVIIPDYSNQLHFSLAESYLASFSDTLIYPYDNSMGLNLGKIQVPYYVNVKLLNDIINISRTHNVLELSADKIISLINHSAFIEFKSLLEQSLSISDLIERADKNKTLFTKALNDLKK